MSFGDGLIDYRRNTEETLLMNDPEQPAAERLDVTRRNFLRWGAAGAAALSTPSLWAASSEPSVLAEAIAKLSYLTPEKDFHVFTREKPRPQDLPEERLREVGLHPDTWRLEVVPDPKSSTRLERPMTEAAGTALDWPGLMKLARTRAVRFLHVLSCTNGAAPFGMGLWEGVPLRDVIWLARPTANVRRVYYYGFHNDDPKQRFVSSLPIGRVLEDAPEQHPVILCYKLNGQFLARRGGAPVRMIVPGAYGNKAVKWVQRVVLTNDFRANDTYAEWNNDVCTRIKTCARFLHTPKTMKPGAPTAIAGVAQVGVSGLRKVQYALQPQDALASKDDPYFTKAPWRDAEILPPPNDWGGGLPDGKLPPIPSQIDPADGRPRTWPLRYTIAHWVALLKDVPPGRYYLRCRTIDAAGVAQPMPRPLPKSGNNRIQTVPLVVT